MRKAHLLLHALARHWLRIAITLLPVLIALLHATGALRLPVLDRLDNIIYDARLQATMPRTLDERIVIVDIDESSLDRLGQWPWSRDKLAALTEELFHRQHVALIGFDVVFAEPDGSTGLSTLRQWAQGPLRHDALFADQLAQWGPRLDHDAQFAQAVQGLPVVLGYYFTSDRGGLTHGALPAPALPAERLQGRTPRMTTWDGYGANIEPIAHAAPHAGFFNPVTDVDGVVRSLPLLAEHAGQYYESLALAMFRVLIGLPEVYPAFAPNYAGASGSHVLASVDLRLNGRTLRLPVDDLAATLIPYRGRGGVHGGSFRYMAAADIVEGKLPPDLLRDKIILIGTTAPGLLDLRVTPVDRAYPGVEVHANVLSGLLDARSLVRPDYAMGYEIAALLATGLLLAFGLPFLGVLRAIFLCALLICVLVGHNLWLYLGDGLVMPLATSLALVLAAFALNMSYGYFIESRSKRELAHLFGTYVPPELVDEMVQSPDHYSMQAIHRELTVMFCDMRGFTAMSETMEPLQLQAMLNEVFSRLTAIIRTHRGTIDKYMGDCVMAFWGAPLESPDHATLAVRAAMDMVGAVHALNDAHAARGLPRIGVGIGLNTGPMCVGDMGSDIRRSYTVIGDSVNLGARLEGLCKIYGVAIVASEATRLQASSLAWQELDRVRVKGKGRAVAIFQPLAQDAPSDWHAFLAAYRAQDWPRAEALLQAFIADGTSPLLRLYQQRLAAMRMLPFDPAWDGATTFDTK